MRELVHVSGEFSICKVADIGFVDLKQQPLFIAVTEEEISIVCKSSNAPQNVLAQEDGWAMLKIAGVLDFSLVGILARIAELLASKGISIFVSSTFNTDYILIKTERLAEAAEQLKSNGYKVHV